VAKDWRSRLPSPLVSKAIEVLQEKFKGVDHYGPQQLSIFYDATGDEAAMYARRAFEIVQKLLSLLTR